MAERLSVEQEVAGPSPVIHPKVPCNIKGIFILLGYLSSLLYEREYCRNMLQ